MKQYMQQVLRLIGLAQTTKFSATNSNCKRHYHLFCIAGQTSAQIKEMIYIIELLIEQ